jgi:CO/xanthine dehydrogenase FAD-binding subunit
MERRSMKPPPFRYERASTTAEALDILGSGGATAKLLAS